MTQRERPPIGQAGLALVNLAMDASALFLLFFALAWISMHLGLPHRAYFAINGIFSLLLLPGWILARHWPSSRLGCVARLYHAALISFALYAVTALACAGVRASFQAFYVTYLALILATAAASLPAYSRRRPRDFLPRWRPACAIAVIIVAAFAVCAYRYPLSSDIAQFTLQQQDMAQSRTFTPSAIGMTALGIFEPMPRWRAYLFHILFSLIADLTNLPVEAVVFQWATIPMAIFALAAMFFFVRAVVGRQPPSWTILAAMLIPATLLWRDFNAYDYSMRLTNNFCLDKDFAGFFLLPSMLYLSVRILRRPNRSSAWQRRNLSRFFVPDTARGCLLDWALLLALAIPAWWFHPLTSVYYAISLPALLAGFWPAVTRKKVLLLGAYAAVLFIVTLGKGDAQSYLQSVDEIVRLDRQRFLEGRPMHYWPGQYAAIPGVDTDTVIWRDGRMALQRRLYTGNSMLLYSAIFTGVWAIALAVRRGRSAFPSHTGHVPRRKTSAVLGGLDIGSQLTPRSQEWRSFRTQLGYLAVLAGIFFFSPIVLGWAPHLYRGYERLHWFYLGMFSIVYCLSLLQNGMVAVAGRLSRPGRPAAWLGVAARWALPAAFWLHLADQTAAIYQGRAALTSRIPHVDSIFDYLAQHDAGALAAAARRRCADTGSVPARPAWLRDTDRVLPLTLFPGRAWYWLQRQSVWWHEICGEGFAYARRGPAFLDQYEAFYDGVDRQLSDRFLRWVAQKRVNVIVFVDGEDFVRELANARDARVTELEPSVWRLERRGTIGRQGKGPVYP